MMIGRATEGGPKPVDARRFLTPDERARMLAQIHSLVYWVGVLVPNHEVVRGEEIDLRQIVFNLTTKDDLTDEEAQEVQTLIIALKDKEHSLEGSLAHDPLTYDAAKAMLEETRGLLKAIDDLRAVETPEKAEVAKQAVLAKVQDARRWQKFVEQIMPKA